MRPSKRPSLREHARNILPWLPPLAGFLAFFAVAYGVEQPGTDFHVVFWPTVRNWFLAGQPLYSGGVLYNPPWTAFFLLPFALVSEDLGRALLACLTMAVVFWSTAYFSLAGRWRLLAIALALSSVHTFRAALVGQVDGFALLGIPLGLWALERLKRPNPGRVSQESDTGALIALSVSFVLISIKPQVMLLVAALYFWELRTLPWRSRLVVLSLPVLVLLSSFPIFGSDWPLRWWTLAQEQPPYQVFTVTTWRAAKELGLPTAVPLAVAVAGVAGGLWAYRLTGLSRGSVALALISGAVATYYSSPSSTMVLLAVTFPWLLSNAPLVAIPVYAFSLNPLLLGSLNTTSEAWADIGFWWALWLASVAIFWRKYARSKPDRAPT